MKREDFDFQKYKQTGTGAEIGVQHGLFSKEMKYDGKVLCIDLWEDKGIYRLARNNLKDPKYALIRSGSEDGSKNVLDESLDFVYIDADHTYESVKKDLSLWIPKVRKGGVVMGHDYFDGEYKGFNFGVKKAVDELGQELSFLDDFDGVGRNFLSWYFIK
jgi:predicted O-methyltransferase YrrM